MMVILRRGCDPQWDPCVARRGRRPLDRHRDRASDLDQARDGSDDFVALGEESTVETEYATRLLGDVTTRQGLGHDGRFFFAQANDPWYIEPEVHAAVLDEPRYRAQRMLFPSVAGGFGFFPPGVVAWSMLVTNLLALGLGAYLAALLALRWGGAAWLGLAVPMNIGLIFELDIGGAGILAYGAASARSQPSSRSGSVWHHSCSRPLR